MTKIYIFTNIQSYTTPYISLVISGYFCEVDKDVALLGYYVASSNFLPKFRTTYQSCLQELDPRAAFKDRVFEDENNRLS
jgi:hypothetical protein